MFFPELRKFNKFHNWVWYWRGQKLYSSTFSCAGNLSSLALTNKEIDFIFSCINTNAWCAFAWVTSTAKWFQIFL